MIEDILKFTDTPIIKEYEYHEYEYVDFHEYDWHQS